MLQEFWKLLYLDVETENKLSKIMERLDFAAKRHAHLLAEERKYNPNLFIISSELIVLCEELIQLELPLSFYRNLAMELERIYSNYEDDDFFFLYWKQLMAFAETLSHQVDDFRNFIMQSCYYKQPVVS